MQLTEEQRMISDMAGSFATEELRPNAERWDREKHMDRSVLVALAGLADLGCLGSMRG